MRPLITLLLAGSLFTAQAQRLTLADLLAVRTCTDTACVNAFAQPKGLCLVGGEEEDGWLWFPCERIHGDSLPERMAALAGASDLNLGFFGYPRSNYHQYSIGTRDTAYAAVLTAELEPLGFTTAEPMPEGQRYRNPALPGVELHRLERRHTSIVPKRPGEPDGPWTKPLSELDAEVAMGLGEEGFDRIDKVPQLLWLFRLVVRK